MQKGALGHKIMLAKENRETGEKPVRSRRCKERVVFNSYIYFLLKKGMEK